MEWSLSVALERHHPSQRIGPDDEVGVDDLFLALCFHRVDDHDPDQRFLDGYSVLQGQLHSLDAPIIKIFDCQEFSNASIGKRFGPAFPIQKNRVLWI